MREPLALRFIFTDEGLCQLIVTLITGAAAVWVDHPVRTPA